MPETGKNSSARKRFSIAAVRPKYRLRLISRFVDEERSPSGMIHSVNVDTVHTITGFMSRSELAEHLRSNPAPEGLIYDLKGLDLSGVDLSGAKLKGSDFTECNLQGVDFSNADLRDANFCYADLGQAVLKSADISNGWFYETRLEDAVFKATKSDNVDFTMARDVLSYAQRMGQQNPNAVTDLAKAWMERRRKKKASPKSHGRHTPF